MNHCGRGGRKIVRARGDEGLSGNRVFHTATAGLLHIGTDISSDRIHNISGQKRIPAWGMGGCNVGKKPHSQLSDYWQLKPARSVFKGVILGLDPYPKAFREHV